MPLCSAFCAWWLSSLWGMISVSRPNIFQALLKSLLILFLAHGRNDSIMSFPSAFWLSIIWTSTVEFFLLFQVLTGFYIIYNISHILIPLFRNAVCPVHHLSRYLHHRAHRSQWHLFVTAQGPPVIARSFRSFLQLVSLLAGLSHLHITPHSFRTGAASMAAALGISSEVIHRMGWWSSSAFMHYIRSQVISLW